LVHEPVCDTHARAERPRIVFREVALAGRFVLNRAGDSTCAWIRRCGIQIRRAAVLLLEVCRIVIPQAHIERQLSGQLPAVLRIEAELMLSDASSRWRLRIRRIDQTEKEARIREADRVAADASGAVRSDDVRKRRLCVAETVLTVQSAGVQVVIALK